MEEVKFSSYADNTVLYTENPKDSIQKLLDLTNELSKVEAYRINTQKSISIIQKKGDLSFNHLNRYLNKDARCHQVNMIPKVLTSEIRQEQDIKCLKLISSVVIIHRQHNHTCRKAKRI